MSVINKLRKKDINEESGPTNVPGRKNYPKEAGHETHGDTNTGKGGKPDYLAGKGQGDVVHNKGDVKKGASKHAEPNPTKYKDEDDFNPKKPLGEEEEIETELEDSEEDFEEVEHTIPSWLALHLRESEEDSEDEDVEDEDSEESSLEDKFAVIDEAANKYRAEMDKDISDAFSSVFEGTELSDEFKSKLFTIFESAVAMKVNAEIEVIAEKYETELDSEVSEILEALTDATDTYLSEIASEWLAENEVAIESGIVTEIQESFMADLRQLFENYNIEVPEGKIDVVREQIEEIEKLYENLDVVTAENRELSEALTEYVMNEVITEASKGLSEVEKQKFINLAENVSFNDIDSYTEKIESLVESVKTPVNNNSKTSPQLVNDTSNLNESNNTVNDTVSRLLQWEKENKY